MNRILVAASVAPVLALMACAGSYDDTPEAVSVPDGAASVHDDPSKDLDPLQSDGTWLVPSQIQPGTYMATQDPQGYSHYWETCINMAGCGNFETDNLIENGNVEGAQDYIIIPPEAGAVYIRGVNLTRVE